MRNTTSYSSQGNNIKHSNIVQNSRC